MKLTRQDGCVHSNILLNGVRQYAVVEASEEEHYILRYAYDASTVRIIGHTQDGSPVTSGYLNDADGQPIIERIVGAVHIERTP